MRRMWCSTVQADTASSPQAPHSLFREIANRAPLSNRNPVCLLVVEETHGFQIAFAVNEFVARASHTFGMAVMDLDCCVLAARPFTPSVSF